MSDIKFAEYIWLDGCQPTQKMRSKTRVVHCEGEVKVSDLPSWSFDGSSTGQAEGHDSDCILKPVSVIPDTVSGGENVLVLCEVYNPDGTPHRSNTRVKLRQALDNGGAEHDPWIGFEQEYTLFEHRNPLGWPENGFPEPQGPYYCGVGSKQIFGRPLAQEHAEKCVEAGLLYYGLNAEVMPGQWEFQIGYRGFKKEVADPLTTADHVWFARWMLHRLAEDYEIHVSFDNKPIKGDWNGAGMHTNFSTKETRDSRKGVEAIQGAVKCLEKNHGAHIAVYGEKLGERLTGLHETCDINTFKSGTADRGASVRIPQSVFLDGCGYFEDRRPGANADPYLVAEKLVTTVCL